MSSRLIAMTSVALVAAAPHPANPEPASPTITLDAATDSLIIHGVAGARRFRLLLTSERLPAGAKPTRAPTGPPIGCDCSTWEERAGNGLEAHRIQSIVLTVGGRARTVPRKFSDRLLSLHVDELRAAVSRDHRSLFVCGSLSDGAGSAMVLWSLSLVGTRDWLRVGDLGTDWPAPDGSCHELGERAPKLTGAARWPLLIQ